jgi:glycosyltransferase involved in cell wall biosynthesis
MIISFFHPSIGGAERQAHQLAIRLLEKGVAVYVLTRRTPGSITYENSHGIPVRRVGTIGQGTLASMSYTVSALAWLFQHHEDLDLLHCHQPFSPMTIGLIAKALWGKPIVVKLTTSGSHGNLSEIRRMPLTSIRKRMMRRVDRFVAVSQEMMTELSSWGFPKEQIDPIPNGVDTERFAPSTLGDKRRVRNALGLEENAQVTIYVGRLTAKKNVDLLLRAWQSVHQAYASARLLLVGDGSERATLQALAEELELGRSVVFCGVQPDVLSYLHAADVFALPSAAEGLSNALLEAMATGLPCIASDIGGNVDLITDGENGLLFEPGNARQLTDALLRLYANGTERQEYGQRAREQTKATYSMDSVTEKYVDLYRRLVAD